MYTEIKGCVKMNKKKLTVIFSIIVGVLLAVFAVFTASAYTDSDPLITLSYLQEIFAPSLKQEILAEAVTVPAGSDVTQAPSSVDEAVPQGANSYTLLELSLGQTVMADSICEFIVRPGSRVAVISPFPSQGVADITNGIEVLGGENVSINAYCLIPRGADGRGLTVLSEKAYIMIRGDYTIG